MHPVTPITPRPAKTMGPYNAMQGNVDAFVLLLDIVSPHGPPFSKIGRDRWPLDSGTHRREWNG